MAQISFRLSDDVSDEFERGRKAQGFATGVDYITALILSGVGLQSGLSERVWEPAAQDARVGGAIGLAIAAIKRGDNTAALDELQFASDLIFQATMERRPAIEEATQQRLRVKQGGDDWTG